jgi:hypothetical protein
LFLPDSRCIALQLQLCLVSSSPSKVEQFCFECCPLSQRSALGSTTCPVFGCWLVTSPLLSAFVLDLCSHLFNKSSVLRVQLLAPPTFSRADSAFHSHLCCQCQITVHCLCFSVLLGGLSALGLHGIIFPRRVGREVVCGA